MATFALIPGAGSGPELWHRVVPELRAAGHDAVTPDLPCDVEGAGLPEYVCAVREAVAAHDDLAVVAHSLGAFTGAALCAEVPARLLVYLNAMIPAHGETPGAWWKAVDHAGAAAELYARHGPLSGWDQAALADAFLHDVPADVAAAAGERTQTGAIFETPLTVWPQVSVRVIAARDDRFFPVAFQRRLARERLGVDVDEIPGGHLAALSQPRVLADQLLTYLP